MNGQTHLNHLNAVTAAASGSWVPAGSLVSYQMTSTGTIAGTFKLQGSNDCVNAVDLATLTGPDGAAGGDFGSYSDCGYRYVRLDLSSVSGTGTCTAHLTTK